MATELRDKSAGKHDAFIEAQLARAEQRIRLIDLCSAGLGFLAGTLAFAVLMIVLDSRFALSATARQLALLAWLAGAAVYLALTVVRPLRWRINPYYAARRLEQTLPGSRNHVVNWIDLHGEKVPSVLKATLGQRAARDLSKADVDRAISSRRALLCGAAAGFFVGLFLIAFLGFGPRPFASLLARTFAPFGASSGIASRTQVEILSPRDTVVTIGNPITIVARVEGRIPNIRDKDAPCLLYRHEEGEQYRQRFLQPDDANREWATTIGPLDVGNGFFYKVTAGDGESPEYRIDVRPAPLLGHFQATYTYRPYVLKASRTSNTRKLDDLRGTDVEIIARTNRTIKEGRLDFEGENGVGDLIAAEPVKDDPQALRFRLTLDRSGKYRIRFTSTDNENYLDQVYYDIRVFPDQPPTVRLTAPAKDVTLPANGHLELKGEAADDYGIARLTLHMEIVGGGELKPKPYLPDKLGDPQFGTPRLVEYSDLIELPALRDDKGAAVELKPGTVIEYWLEAADACDYPQGTKGNVTLSQPRYKITIAPPEKDEQKEQKEQKAARERQKERDKQQAEQMKKEKQEKEEQRRKEEEQNRQEQKNQKDKKGESGKEPDKKKEGKEGKPEPKNGNNGTKDKDDKTRRQAEQIKEAMKNKEQKGKEDKGGEDKRGEARGEDNKPGQGKDGEKKPGDDKGKDKPGESRGNGGQNSKDPAGTKKDGAGKEGDKGAAREGKADPTDRNGQGKNGGDKSEGKKPGECKAPAEPKKPGEGKGPGKGASPKEAGQSKPQGDPKPGDRLSQGEARDAKTDGKPTDGKPAAGKDGSRRAPTGARSEGKTRGEKAGEGKPGAGAKSGKDAGRNKPAGSGAGGAAGQKKPDGDQGQRRAENAKPSDVEKIARALKEMDGASRGEARRALEDIKDKASDPAAREAAKKAIEEAKKDARPGQGKPAPRGEEGDKGEKKPGPGGESKAPGEAKGGEPPADPAGGSGKGPARSGKPEEGKEGEGPGKGKAPSDRDGYNPGAGMTGDRTSTAGSPGAEKRPEKEKPAAHRASTMQLDEFRKKVDKDILKDAKMSPEEFEKFLRDYADLAKRTEKAEPETPEVLPRPGPGKELPNLVGRPGKRGDKTNGEAPSVGRPKPPPEYRGRVSDFDRLLQSPTKK